MHKIVSGIRDTVERTYDQIWNDMSFVHELVSGIRDTVEHMYDQICNIFATLTSVGLAQAHPNYLPLLPDKLWN